MFALLIIPGSAPAFTILEFEPKTAEDCIIKYQKKVQCDRAAGIVVSVCRCKFNLSCYYYSQKAMKCILKNIGDAKTDMAATGIASACNRKQ